MSFDAEWARCAPWIEAALQAGWPTHTMDEVKAEVLRGEADFWAGRAAAVVTQVVDHPRFRTLHVWLAGGDLAELRDDLRPRVEAFAQARGCRFISLTGRPGWAKALGYRPVSTTCAKELT